VAGATDRPTRTRSGEGWHPEPELLDIRDEGRSRPALERLGQGAWSAALDYVYEHGMERAIGEPADYAEYSELEPEFIDGFVDAVVDWMVLHTDVAE
jgi:hypothetical protein